VPAELNTVLYPSRTSTSEGHVQRGCSVLSRTSIRSITSAMKSTATRSDLSRRSRPRHDGPSRSTTLRTSLLARRPTRLRRGGVARATDVANGLLVAKVRDTEGMS